MLPAHLPRAPSCDAPPTDAPRSAVGEIRGAAHLFAVRVYFEDTDAGGIVYHANYLRFMERARSDLLACLGIDQRRALDQGTGVYAIADLSIRYLKPARLDDSLTVVTRPTRVRAAALDIAQSVWRGAEQLASARVTAAFLSPAGRPVRQPGAWADAFSALLSKETAIP